MGSGVAEQPQRRHVHPVARQPRPNVPDTTANLWTSYQDIAGWPLELGGSVRYVGDRFANNANLITMKAYTTAGLYAAWTRDRLRLTAASTTSPMPSLPPGPTRSTSARTTRRSYTRTS